MSSYRKGKYTPEKRSVWAIGHFSRNSSQIGKGSSTQSESRWSKSLAQSATGARLLMLFRPVARHQWRIRDNWLWRARPCFRDRKEPHRRRFPGRRRIRLLRKVRARERRSERGPGRARGRRALSTKPWSRIYAGEHSRDISPLANCRPPSRRQPAHWSERVTP